MLVLRYCNKDAERREKREKGKRLATEVIGKYQQNKVHIQKRGKKIYLQTECRVIFWETQYHHHLEVVWGRWG